MATKWNFKTQFPSDSDFINRITDITFGESKSSGNPMLTMEAEVVSPSEKEVGGEVIDISGVKTKSYFTCVVLNDEEKTAAAQDRLKKILGDILPDDPEAVANFNFENPDPETLKKIKGRLIMTQMSPDVEEQRKDPTAAEIEAAKKLGKRAEGKPQLHPVTGKPLISYRPQIREIYGLAPEAIASSIGSKTPY